MKNEFSALPVLYAACDPHYFQKHGRAFIKSGLEAGHYVHVLVHAKPGPNLKDRTRRLKEGIIKRFFATLSPVQQARTVIEAVALKEAKDVPNGNELIFYQRIRFLRLPKVLARYGRPILTVDIDSLIRKPVRWDRPEPIGLYVREDAHTMATKKRMKREMVMGGFIYIDPTASDFADKIVARLKVQGLAPYSDQVALFHVYGAEDKARIFNIAHEGWFDWAFDDEALIWTAKGARRRRSQKYIEARLEVEGRSALVSNLIKLHYALLRKILDRPKKKRPVQPVVTG